MCSHSSERYIMHYAKVSTIRWLIMILVCLHTHFKGVGVSCGKALNRLVSQIKSNNVLQSLECWYKFLLSTIMWHIKLLSCLSMLFLISSEISRKHEGFIIIMKSEGLLMFSWNIKKKQWLKKCSILDIISMPGKFMHR